MDYWNLIRGINIGLALFLAATMIIRYVRWVGTVDTRLFRLGLATYLVVGCYSTIEIAVRGVPGSPRLVAQLVALVWLTLASYWPQAVAVGHRARSAARRVLRRHPAGTERRVRLP